MRGEACKGMYLGQLCGMTGLGVLRTVCAVVATSERILGAGMTPLLAKMRKRPLSPRASYGLVRHRFGVRNLWNLHAK